MHLKIEDRILKIGRAIATLTHHLESHCEDGSSSEKGYEYYQRYECLQKH